MLGCSGQISPGATRQAISLSWGLRELILDCLTSALAMNAFVGVGPVVSHVGGKEPSEAL